MADDLFDQLDEPPRAGLVHERGFWRHPITKAAMVTMPDGARRQLRSPSGDFKAHIESTVNLEKWKQRQIVVGMLAMDLTAIDLPDDTENRRHVLDGLVLEAMDLAGSNVAADQGTHTHLTTELDDEGAHWLTVAEHGESTGLPAPVQAALVRAWRQLLDDAGLEILAVELTVANRTAAGTLDRIARTTRDLEFHVGRRLVEIPAGTVLVLDIKTGQLRVDRSGHPRYWVGYAHQIGHYANAAPVEIDPDDPSVTVWRTWEDLGLEHPSTVHALIAHLDVAAALDGLATARLVYVDLGDYDPINSVIDEIRYHRRAKPFSRCDTAPDVAVVVQLDGQPLAVTPERVSWLQGRINLLGMTDDGRRLLGRHWPDHPPLHRYPDITPEEFDHLIALVDRVEDECSSPFPENDPGAPKPTPKPRGGNPATGGSSNEQ